MKNAKYSAGSTGHGSFRSQRFLGYIFVVLAMIFFGIPMALAGQASDIASELGWPKAIAIILAGSGVSFLIARFFWTRGSVNVHVAARLATLDSVPHSTADTRPPVLYLRSFQDDGVAPKHADLTNLLGSAMCRTDEQKLVEGLKTMGPVVAIGKPREPIPEVGAVRTYSSDSEWQERVKSLMQTAQIVVIRCGTTQSLLWELQTSIRHVRPERLLLWLMFTEKREDLWNHFCSTVQSWLPVKLPAKIGNALFLSFDGKWNPELFGSVRNIQGPLDPKVLLPFLRRLHPDSAVSLKRDLPILRGIRVLAICQVIAVWIGLVLSIVTGSSRVLTFWAILCGTGVVLAAVALSQKLWPAVLLGSLISPVIFLAVCTHMPRDNDPKDPTAWVLIIGPLAALVLLVWLEVSLERTRDCRVQIND